MSYSEQNNPYNLMKTVKFDQTPEAYCNGIVTATMLPWMTLPRQS